MCDEGMGTWETISNTFGTRDLNLMIHPEIEAIVEAGTDESTVRDKTIQMFFEFGRLLE